MRPQRAVRPQLETPKEGVPTREPSPGAPPETNAGDLFDYELVRDYVGFALRASRRHKLLAIACAIAVMGLAAAALFVLPKRYQVQARILAQRNAVMTTLSNPGLPRPYDWDAPTRAARETVLRRDNLVKLCEQIGFVDKYLASRPPVVELRDWVVERLGHVRTRADLLDTLIDTLERRLWVEVGGEGTVTITFQWSDKAVAYQVVESATQSFLEARHASELSEMGESLAILESHAARVEQDLKASADRLDAKERAVRRSMTAARPPPRRPRVASDLEIARLQALLETKRRALADLETFRARRFSELQAQLAQQESVYADRHPAVQATRQNMDSLQQPSPQVEALRSESAELEREIARRGGASLDRAPDAERTDWAEAFLSRLDDSDPRLEYERGQLRLLLRQYAALLDRMFSARMEMDTAEAAFKYRYSIISPPQMPKRPIKPNPVLVIVGGVLGGIAFGLFAAAAADVRSGRILEPWQVSRQLQLRLVAHLRR